ncbi:MAG: sulfurtransferase complex subunit TusC [Anaerolineaceae bacterium]|nr:sulfurtransferase complex subunit TusC [Anaerolineaceae bacterium]
MEKVIVLLRKAPYGSVYSAEAFRTIMGIAVFEMDICVAFADDGVYTLVKNQNPEKLDMKPLGDGFPMLKDFNVNRFVVHKESLRERGLSAEDLVIDVEIANNEKFAQIIDEYGRVLPF